MNIVVFLLVGLVASAAAQQCPTFPTPVPIPADNPFIKIAGLAVDSYLTQQVGNMQIPGLVAAVVYDQDIVWSKGYGNQDPFNSTSPAPSIDSVVRIASITKVFTDIMMFQLRDAGLINLDDPVTKYIPNFLMKDPFTTKRPTTLRQLSSHTAGLPREVPCDWYATCSETEILKNLSQMAYVLPPYTKPHYSNLGLALLGRTLQRVAKVSYEDYVTKNILLPLNMTSSGFDFSAIAANLAIGVTQLNNGSFVRAPIDSLGWGTPMGGMFASVRDMAKFISFMFRDNAIEGKNQVLDGATIRESLSPIIVTPDGQTAFGTPWEYAYDAKNSVWIRSKAGELAGYRSQIALIPELKLGVFISSMIDVDDSTNSIFTVPVLDMLFGPFVSVLTQLQPKPILPSNYKSYVGLYTLNNSIYNSIDWQVYVQDDVMYGAYANGNQTFATVTLTEVSANIFRMETVTRTSCRWQDDGMDLELIYFGVSGNKVQQVTVMGQLFRFVSHNCSSC